MKILVLGAGSIGKAIKEGFAHFGEVITAGRKDCDIYLELGESAEAMFLPDSIDTIVHTAAHFGGRTGRDIIDAENINVLGTLKLCEAALRSGVKHFVFVSSAFSVLREDSPNYTIYSLSKRHAEEAIRYFCSLHSMHLTILRPSQVYGNEESFRKHQPFFYSIIDKAERGEDISFYGSNDALRNYIHIDDLAMIMAEVVKKRIYGIYGCVYPENITYSKIAKAAFAAFGNSGNILFLKEKPDIPDNLFEMDPNLYEQIGFYPQIAIEEGMRRMANYRNSRR